MKSQSEGDQSGHGDIFRYESGVRSYCRRFDATFAAASGSLVTDTTGRRYIDFLAGCSALNYGHNDPDLVGALSNYLTSGGLIHGLDLQTPAKAHFIERFVEQLLTPRGWSYQLQFTGPTGTNAVEAALKLARKVTGRTNVVAFTNGYHGVTSGALAATGSSFHRMAATTPLVGVQRLFYDGYLGSGTDTVELLDQVLSDPSSGFDPPAAVILETVQGEGGLNAASPEWLEGVARVTRAHGALLVVDDIQAGCGRTGSFFSFDHTAVQPDMITLSKSLSGVGLPLALVLIKPEFDHWLPAEHNGTFRGNNLAFVTAAVAIDKFWSDDRLSTETVRKAVLIQSSLTGFAEFVPGARVKGRGMMLGLDVGGALADAVSRRCFREGLIIETSGPHDEVLKVLAPLTTPDDVLAEGLGILGRAIAAEAEALGPRA